MSHKLTTSSLIFFSLPLIVSNMLILPLLSIMPAYYAKHTAITMAAVGTVMIVSRLIDAITDPLIGYLSDRTRSPIGRRKPWLIAGGVLAMLSAQNLFVPPADAGALHFGFWSICAYQAWTMITIPHLSWGSELSSDYNERARVFAYLNIFGSIGTALLIMTPLLLYPLTGTTIMGPEVLGYIPWGIYIFAPLFIMTAVFLAPEGENSSAGKSEQFFVLIKAIKNNSLFWKFISVVALAGVARGMEMALYFLLLDNYLQIGKHFSVLTATFTITTVFSIAFWKKMIDLFDKHRTWAVSMFLSPVIFLSIQFIDPGPSAFYPFLMVSIYSGFLGGSILVSQPSMLSDIIDLDILKSGNNKTGSYFSFYGLLIKVNLAVGAGIAFLIVDIFGYDAKITNTGLANSGLLLTYAGIPAILLIIAGLIIWRYPLDARRQSIIRRRIDQRTQRTQLKMES